MVCVHLGVTTDNAKVYLVSLSTSDSNVDASVCECDTVGNINIANSSLSLDLFLQYVFFINYSWAFVHSLRSWIGISLLLNFHCDHP